MCQNSHDPYVEVLTRVHDVGVGHVVAHERGVTMCGVHSSNLMELKGESVDVELVMPCPRCEALIGLLCLPSCSAN